MRLRLLTVLLIALALASGLAVTTSTPADAATKNAGIPDLTPYGGYLGNYLAPDGSRVYCIDSPLPWPSGETAGPTSIDSLTTTWGAVLPAAHLRKLNYVLLSYGQTDDPVQAAAVAAFVNAYTSGWARDLGAGYAAGAWYLNGNAAVSGVYDTIWADAEANADPQGTAAVRLDLTAPTEGTATITASPPDATGSLTLTGAVRADTGESAFAVGPDETIPIRGVPADDARDYEITAEATFTAPTSAGANLVLYTTPDQQRTIRGGTPDSISFAAVARTGPVPLDFTPVLSTSVEAASVEEGEPMVDRLSVAIAAGSRPWRVRADGTPVPLVAEGVLYGPFAEPPATSPAVPPSAPVAGRETVTLNGPGEYTSGSTVAREPGFYTWVWTIDATRQDVVGAAGLPAGYVFASPFGLAEETHSVHAPPPRLAATGSAPRDAGLVGAALVVCGALLITTRRRGNKST